MTMLERLIKNIKSLGSVAVAYSGGVDSSVVAAAAVRALGDGNVLAVTARSQTYPARELAVAEEICQGAGIPHLVIDTRETECEDFSANSPERCFYCKRELWEKIGEVAAGRGLRRLADGVNADDLGDFRPGIRASDEAGVAHPLAEIGAGKDDVRWLARKLGLPNWEKPAQACLSSRFPYGQRITAEGLQRVELAEDFLFGLGLAELRVRDHGDIARIEVPPEALAKVAGNGAREAIVLRFKELGYSYVTIDLEGFRSGSMNEALKASPHSGE